MKTKIVLSLILSAFSVQSMAAVGQAWAWDANKISNNGSVTLGSTNGSSTYSAVQNPTGAVAKINQSSITQPPTIIIQATSSSGGSVAPQCVPKLVSNVTRPAIPNCEAGYTKVWSDRSLSASGGWYIDTCATESGADVVYNINGSPLSFVRLNNSSNYPTRGFSILSSSSSISGGGYNDASITPAMCYSGTYTYAWAAAVCCK